jgi:hypothetical protein
MTTAGTTVGTELAEGLKLHAIRMRERAAALRRRAAEALERGRIQAAAFHGPGMEFLYKQSLAAGTDQADAFNREADRLELWAERADEGKLLLGAAEHQDREFMDRGGYRLIRLAREAGAIVRE